MKFLHGSGGTPPLLHCTLNVYHMINTLRFNLQYVGDKLSRKILDQALEQQDELEAEYSGTALRKGKKPLAEARTSLGGTSRPQAAGSDSESDSEDNLSEGEDQYYEDVVSRNSMLFCPAKQHKRMPVIRQMF